jgi:hypothetical protein
VAFTHLKSKTEALANLRVARRMAPDRDGARKLALRYGEALVCVRHRLNSAGTVRFTTVELLVEQTPVVPTGVRLVAVRLEPGDRPTRALLLSCGAHWDRTQKVWMVPRKVVKTFGLLDRVVSLAGKP